MLLFIIFFLMVLFPFVCESDILFSVPYILNHRRREGRVTGIIFFAEFINLNVPSFRAYIVIYISTKVKVIKGG